MYALLSGSCDRFTALHLACGTAANPRFLFGLLLVEGDDMRERSW